MVSLFLEMNGYKYVQWIKHTSLAGVIIRLPNYCSSILEPINGEDLSSQVNEI